VRGIIEVQDLEQVTASGEMRSQAAQRDLFTRLTEFVTITDKYGTVLEDQDDPLSPHFFFKLSALGLRLNYGRRKLLLEAGFPV
jgi:hypothetical protein